MITNAEDLKIGPLAPLYHQYQGQFECQLAYVELDPNNESLYADWNAEIGNAVPFSVYHGRKMRYRVNPAVRGTAIAKLLEREDVQDLARRIIAGYSEEWDGNNNVGVLDDDAQAAEEELAILLGEESDDKAVEVWDAYTWLGDTTDLIRIGETLEDCAVRLREEAANDGVHIRDDIEDVLRGV